MFYASENVVAQVVIQHNEKGLFLATNDDNKPVNSEDMKSALMGTNTRISAEKEGIVGTASRRTRTVNRPLTKRKAAICNY